MAAVHGDLVAVELVVSLVEFVISVEYVIDCEGIAGVKCQQCVTQDPMALAAEAFGNKSAQFFYAELKNPGQQAERENILPLFFSSSSNRFDSQTCYWHSNIDKPLILQIWPHMIGIIKQHPAISQRM